MAEKQYRIDKGKGFTVVYRSVAQDSRLTLKARGLFLFMQSLPSNWSFSQASLAKYTGVGRDAIRAALAELEKVGYLRREEKQSHDGTGHFSQFDYVLLTESPEPPPPLFGNPTTVNVENAPLLENPSTGKPSAENPTLQNIDNTNTPLTPQGGVACADENPKELRAKTAPKWNPERFERFWQFYRDKAKGKHGHRFAAVKAWDKLKPDDDTLNKMGLCLMNQSQSDMWRRGVGIPYASTWLNRRDWEDEAEPMPDVSSTEVTGWTE